MADSPAMQYAAPAPLAATISFNQTCDHELLDFHWFYGCVSTLPSAFCINGAAGSPDGTATSHITCDYNLIACGQNGKSCGTACADIIKARHLDRHGTSHNPGVEAALLLQCDKIKGRPAALTSISAKANNAAVISMQQCSRPGSGSGSASLAASTKWLRQVFDTFDENKDGMLSMEELRRSLEKLGIETSKESIDSLVSHSLASKDKKGLVSHDDFLFLYQGGSCIHDNVEHMVDCKIMNEHASDEELLRDAFNVFDKDRNGFISPIELQAVLRSLGFGAAQELDECTDMIKKYDQDGDGQVNFEEFKAMLNLAIKHT